MDVRESFHCSSNRMACVENAGIILLFCFFGVIVLIDMSDAVEELLRLP